MAQDKFKETTKAYLDQRAESDPLFAVNYAKEHKNIDDCVAFIIGEARRLAAKGGDKGCGIFPDAEVFGWAVHFYDEDEINVSKIDNSNVKIVAPATVKKIEMAAPEAAIVQSTLFEL